MNCDSLQIEISQIKSPEVIPVLPAKRQSHFSKFVRNSLSRNSSGRLSVPWANSTLGDITFGEESKSNVIDTIEENEEEEEEDDEENEVYDLNIETCHGKLTISASLAFKAYECSCLYPRSKIQFVFLNSVDFFNMEAFEKEWVNSENH